jgi:chromosome segregation ATPase
MKKGLVLILLVLVLVLTGCENKKQKQDLEAAMAKIVDLQAELDAVKAECDDLKIDKSATDGFMSQMKDKVAALESVEKGKEVLQQQYDNLKKSSVESMDKLKEWQSKAKDYLSEIDNLKTANDKLQSMIDSLKGEAGEIKLPEMPK